MLGASRLYNKIGRTLDLARFFLLTPEDMQEVRTC